MSEEEALPESEDGDDIGVVVLMLGLYLIVLAFFILLNAISEDSPEKHDLVVESVKEGFDFREDGPGKGSDPTDITAIPSYKAVVQSLDGMMQSHLQIDEFDVVGDANKVQMKLDINRFFYKGEVRIIPDMILFFEDLSEIMGANRKGTTVQAQVMVSGDTSTLTDQTPYDDFSLAGRRSALFVRALIDEGIRGQSISAGAYRGEPAILLTFHIFSDGSDPTQSEQLHEVMEQLGGSASSGNVNQ